MSGRKLRDFAVSSGLAAPEPPLPVARIRLAVDRHADRAASAQRLRNSGLSYRRIAETLNVPYALVSRWLSGVAPDSAPPPAPGVTDRPAPATPAQLPPAPPPGLVGEAPELQALRAQLGALATYARDLATRLERLDSGTRQRLEALEEELRQTRAGFAAELAALRAGAEDSRHPRRLADRLAFWRSDHP